MLSFKQLGIWNASLEIHAEPGSELPRKLSGREEKQCNNMTPVGLASALLNRPEIAFQLYCSDPMFQ